jgi:hypothetical protein
MCPGISTCLATAPYFSEGFDSLGLPQALGYVGSLFTYSEKLNAVLHADGKSWWVLIHDSDNDDFFTYLFRGTGISGPQVQSIGTAYGAALGNPYGSIGEMTFSPDGTKLLSVGVLGYIDLYDFDRCTGQLSNWIPLGAIAPIGVNNNYGCSFSPDGTKIYVSEGFNPSGDRLFQFDLNAPNILASKTELFRDTMGMVFGQHQLGPDGKIYITGKDTTLSNPGNFALSVVNDPNQPGMACNYTHLSLPLHGLRTSFNLPNLPNYNLGPLLAQTAEAGPPQAILCLGDSLQIGYPDTTGGAVTYAWQNHPDIADTTQPQQWVAPTQSTWYYLTVVDSAFGIPCGVTRDSIHVIVADSSYFPVANAGPDQTVCLGGSAIFSAGSVSSQWTYHWNTGIDSTSIVTTQTGTYTLIVNNPIGVGACLSDTDHVELRNFSVRHAPLDAAGSDTIICYGDSVEIGEFSPGYVYEWIQGPTTPDTLPAWVNDVGEYILAIYLPPSSGGCLVGYDSVYVSSCHVGQIVFHGIPLLTL